jgi:hypothetical protein
MFVFPWSIFEKKPEELKPTFWAMYLWEKWGLRFFSAS